MATKYVFIASDNEWGNERFQESNLTIENIINKLQDLENTSSGDVERLFFYFDDELGPNDCKSVHDFYAEFRYFYATMSESEFNEIIETFVDYEDSKHFGYYHVGEI